MSDALDLNPLLAAVMRDHEKYREAREAGRRAGNELAENLDAIVKQRLQHLEAMRFPLFVPSPSGGA